MSKPSLLSLQYQRSMLTPVLSDIEVQGLYLDKAKVKALYAEYVNLKNGLSQQLFEISGGINLNSGKQLAEFLYDKLGIEESSVKTPKGERSTSEEAIAALKPKTKEQKAFLESYKELREVSSVLSKYLELFNAVVDEASSRMYGQLNQGRTATHRLSSSGVPFKSKAFKKTKSVQFQNIPRDLKKLFVSHDPENYYVAEADGSQIEFRVAAGLASDPVALKEIIDLVDVHSVTASVIGCSRQDAKSRTFAPLYGGNGANKLEREYCQFFRKKYSAISTMQKDWCWEVAQRKDNILLLPYGMQFIFPGTRIQGDGYISNSTNIHNYPIQNLATGEIIPIALAWMWHNLPTDGSIIIVNTVHDSIVCFVRKDSVARYIDLSIRAMTFAVYEFLERVYGYHLTAPLGVGIKVGEYWGGGDERSFQYEDGDIVEIVKLDGVKVKVPYDSKSLEEI